MANSNFDFGAGKPEGLWCVRWIGDFVEHAPSDKMPQIEMFLSEISDPDWETLPFAQALKGRRVSRPPNQDAQLNLRWEKVRIDPGLLARLKLGMVLRDGTVVGRLKSTLREFVFDLPTALLGPRHGMFQAKDSAETFLGARDKANIISGVYDIPGRRRDALVTVLQSATDTLVLPSSEVIRAFMAPVSALAHDLAYPPPLPMNRILRAPPVVTEDRNWRLDLYDAVAVRHAPLIANLQSLFNPVGGVALETVYRERFETNRLAGRLPFTDCTLRLKAFVIPIAGDRWLGLEVTNVTWPLAGQPMIEVVRWKPEAEPGDAPEEVPGYRIKPRPDTTLRNVSDASPDYQADKALEDVEGVVWSDLPVPQVRKQSFRPVRDKVVFPATIQRTDVVSVGLPDAGTGVAGLLQSQIPTEDDIAPEGVSRFAGIVVMLDGFKSTGSIHAWSTVACKVAGASAQRGGVPVWRFGPPNNSLEPVPAWCWVNRVEKRRRTMLVCQVDLRSGNRVLWVEIEPRDNNHPSPALIVALERDLETDEQEALLRAVEKDEGFGAVLLSEGLPSATKCKRWYRSRRPPPLNVVRALRAMEALAAQIV